jgi:carbon monoxide dehydrogenase subunit G
MIVRHPPIAVVLAIVLATFSLAGCGRSVAGAPVPALGPGVTTTAPSTPPVTTTAPVTTTIPAPTTTRPSGVTAQVSVYFAQNGKLVPVRRTVAGPGVAAAAIRALLAGPDAAERRAGMSSSVPAGTSLRDVSVHGGTAIADLDRTYESGGGTASMTARLGQVVFTLTQFPAIQRVTFAIEGTPVRVLGGEGIVLDHPSVRADFEDITPAVLVESPTFGATVRGPLRVHGTANTFEAVFGLQLTDHGGRTLVNQRVQASSGTGTRGTFDVTLRFTVLAAGPGTLIAWYASPQDGGRVVVVEIPIELRR